MTIGVALIAKERQKQITKHGFTGEHHAQHPEWYDNRQLQEAATTLLMHELQEVVYADEHLPDEWDKEWFEDLNRRPREERLIIAGALIASELDRLHALGALESVPTLLGKWTDEDMVAFGVEVKSHFLKRGMPSFIENSIQELLSQFKGKGV